MVTLKVNPNLVLKEFNQPPLHTQSLLINLFLPHLHEFLLLLLTTTQQVPSPGVSRINRTTTVNLWLTTPAALTTIPKTNLYSQMSFLTIFTSRYA